jgi:hypothetical protein
MKMKSKDTRFEDMQLRPCEQVKNDKVINTYHTFDKSKIKSKKLVIAKIFAYILTWDYNNSKTSKKKTKSLKLSRNRC